MRAERVLTVNPLFSLRRQINSFSLEEKSLLGPVLALFVSGQSFPFQQWMVSKGQTASRKLCKTSNCGGVRLMKCFVRTASRTMFSV